MRKVKREISREAARRLAYNAATDPLHGRRAGRASFEHSVSGRCEEPRVVRVVGPRDTKGVSDRPGLQTDLEVRCRRCRSCKAEKQSSWAARAIKEMECSPRTWFGTLTLRPAEHMHLLAKARSMLAAQRLPYTEVAAHRKARRLALAEVSKFLKRLRKGGQFVHETGEVLKQPPSSIRYLAVEELHKEKLDGFPHYHLLIHELAGQPPLPRRWLASTWAHGFVMWKLAKKNDAWYCAKYVAKETASRVRASRNYGEPSQAKKPPATSEQSVGGSVVSGFRVVTTPSPVEEAPSSVEPSTLGEVSNG